MNARNDDNEKLAIELGMILVRLAGVLCYDARSVERISVAMADLRAMQHRLAPNLYDSRGQPVKGAMR